MSDYILSVSQLNKYASGILSDDPLLRSLSVRGEISNFKRHSSGHLYFALKDESAVIRSVMFRQSEFGLNFRPENGMQVVANGSVRLYEKDGQYQLYVSSMELQGSGDLYRRFIELKDKLEKQGLFDESRKRKIPFLPRCVGIVTSPTGAAIHDIFSVIGRRFPTMNILFYPAKVQGDGAAETVIRGIEALNRSGEPDVIIIGRGGGSIEDLWAFNDGKLALAIYNSRIPVVSAVGHETDFSISDFAADLRAATPSAAAELCVPSLDALNERISAMRAKLAGAAENAVRIERRRVAAASDPKLLLRTLDAARIRADRAQDSIKASVEMRLRELRAAVEANHSLLNSLDPRAVMKRGYAAVRLKNGQAVSSVNELTRGDILRVGFIDGSVEAAVNDISLEDKHD